MCWLPVSQICALITLPSVLMLLVANSTPIVAFASSVNSLRVKRASRLDLPTPESPIRTTVQSQQQTNIKQVCMSKLASRVWQVAAAKPSRAKIKRTFEEVVIVFILCR